MTLEIYRTSDVKKPTIVSTKGKLFKGKMEETRRVEFAELSEFQENSEKE